MTVHEMKAYLTAVLSPTQRTQWLKDQRKGKRPSWDELAWIYTQKGM